MIESQESSSKRASSAALAGAFLRLVRPHQWVKNAVVLAGLVFAQLADQPPEVINALTALVAFVFASAAVYIANDARDVEADRRHPLKRTRPIASGEIEAGLALRVGALLGIASLVLGALVTPALAIIIAGYIAIMLAYTVWLKHVAILDVTVIAIGFVMRAVGGAVAVSVPISPWLLLCAFLLALFLGFGKRRAELIAFGNNAYLSRQVLQGYTAPLLDQLVRISAVSALVTYATYTVMSSAVPRNDAMLYTVPVVAFAIFRYLYLIYGRGLGESPERLLFRDRWLLAAVLLWGVLALVIMKSHGEIWPFA